MSEEEPLVTDVEELLERVVRVRLDRVRPDGSFAPLEKPKRVPLVESEQEPPGLHLDCAPQCPPSEPDITHLLLVHVPDLLVQVVYIVGAYVVLQSGSEVFSEGQHMPADEAASENALERQLMLWYWAIFVGALVATFLVLKSVVTIALEVFELIDRLEGVVSEAIARLQVELEGDVSEVLEDAMSLGTLRSPRDMEETRAVHSSASRGVAAACSAAVASAHQSLDVQSLLPWALTNHLLFAALCSVPFLAVVSTKAYLDYESGTGPEDVTGIPTEPIEGEDRDSDVAGSLRLMWGNVLLNLLWILIGTWPIQIFCTNCSIVLVERRMNDYLLAAAKANIPGGVGCVQAMLNNANGTSTPRDRPDSSCALQ